MTAKQPTVLPPEPGLYVMDTRKETYDKVAPWHEPVFLSETDKKLSSLNSLASYAKANWGRCGDLREAIEVDGAVHFFNNTRMTGVDWREFNTWTYHWYCLCGHCPQGLGRATRQ
jgi:hypothetical protein